MREAILLLALIPWVFIGLPRFFHLVDYKDCPPQDALGQTILWPLFALKFVIVALFRAAKELVA